MNTSVSDELASSTYIIVDGALINAPLLAYKYDNEPWFDQLYRGTRHSRAQEVSPCLIRPSESSRLWEHQSEWGPFGIGVRTHASAAQLIGHLRSLISVRLPNGQLSYCRFYSNKHLPQLLRAFTEQELRSFSGPILSWFSTHKTSSFDELYLDGFGAVRTLESEGWFQLKTEHLDALNRAREAEFSHKLCQHLGVQHDAHTMNAVKCWQDQAQQNGFFSEREAATFVELAWGQEERIKSSACQQILNDTNSTAYQKLTALDHQLAYGDA